MAGIGAQAAVALAAQRLDRVGEGTVVLVNPLGRQVKLSRRTLKLLIEDLQKASSTCKFLAQACAVVGAVFIADQMARSTWAAIQDARRRHALSAEDSALAEVATREMQATQHVMPW